MPVVTVIWEILFRCCEKKKSVWGKGENISGFSVVRERLCKQKALWAKVFIPKEDQQNVTH